MGSLARPVIFRLPLYARPFSPSNTSIPLKVDLSFSIIYEDYNGTETSLDVICGSKSEFEAWFDEINQIVKYHNMKKDSGDRVLRFAKRQWSMADRDGDGSLDLKEITAMISKLNINLDSSYIKKMFHEIDVDKSGSLDYMEFQVSIEDGHPCCCCSWFCCSCTPVNPLSPLLPRSSSITSPSATISTLFGHPSSMVTFSSQTFPSFLLSPPSPTPPSSRLRSPPRPSTSS